MNKNDIYVTHGRDAECMTRELLNSVDVCSLVGSNKDAYIGLKPNLVNATPSTEGATTTPLIVHTIAKYLKEHGYHNICIIESSWVGCNTKKAMKVCGYDKICDELDIPFIDVKDDSCEIFKVDGMKIEMSKQVMSLDFLINIPVLKGHCQTNLTCALKNLKGCISDASKRYFHTIGLHRPIAATAKIRCADLVVVDSLNGDLDFEEGGNPVQTDRMLAGTDSVLVDAYCAELLGYSVVDVPYIRYAEAYGVGSSDVSRANIVTLKPPVSGLDGNSARKVKQLEKYVNQKDACSACYAGVIRALCVYGQRNLPAIYVGQGYRNKSENGLGIGNCCAGFDQNIKGCPPRPADIVRALKSYR